MDKWQSGLHKKLSDFAGDGPDVAACSVPPVVLGITKAEAYVIVNMMDATQRLTDFMAATIKMSMDKS